jgi:hypothetical protein
MKYTTFRNIAAIVGVMLAGSAVFVCYRASDPERRGGAAALSSGKGGRPSDSEIMAAFQKNPTSDKKKDVFPSAGAKVNFYADGGASFWNRAKIDYDRDEKADEKWDRDPSTGQISRKLAPADDEEYSVSEVWNGSAFVPEGEAIAPVPIPEPSALASPSPGASPAGAPGVATGARPMDKLIVEFVSKTPATSDKIKDAFPRETFKVNLYHDAGTTGWNRLKIDLDRDEKWDEKWDFENGLPAKRHVSSADNDSYDQEFRWLGGQWEAK